MKSAILTVLISTTALVGTSIAQAQVSIRDLQRNLGISISGEIRSVVGNEFILDDGTGQIIVDAGPRWYHQLNFTPPHDRSCHEATSLIWWFFGQ
jgi:uncharacterized protein YdeI (BOF family)